MVSRIESSENRVAFKKRSLRPWKPIIELEKPVNDDAKVASGYFDNDLNNEFPLELLHKPSETNLEASLESSNKQHSEIRAKLSALQNNRVTVGGFFKPKNVLFLDEQESSEQTFFLLSALKDREHEIAELQHKIKLVEAVEQIQQSSIELSAEKNARLAAEERIILTQRKAEQAIEMSQSLEEKLSIAEQIQSKLEHRSLQLEKTLKETSQNFEAQLRAQSLEAEKLQGIKQFEIDLRKRSEEELYLVKIQRQTLENELSEKIQAYQELEALLAASRTEIQRVALEGKGFETNLRLTTDKLIQTETILAEEKSKAGILEAEYQQKQTEIQASILEAKAFEAHLMATTEKLIQTETILAAERTSHGELAIQFKQREDEQNRLQLHSQALEQQLAQEKIAFQEKIAPFLDHMKKINVILQGEKSLRQHLEAKTRELAGQIFNLELRIQTEEYARKLADEKVKLTLTRASEALLNVLNQPEMAESIVAEK